MFGSNKKLKDIHLKIISCKNNDDLLIIEDLSLDDELVANQDGKGNEESVAGSNDIKHIYIYATNVIDVLEVHKDQPNINEVKYQIPWNVSNIYLIWNPW